ncbi:MAG: carbamate kinase [Vicinamibacteraceae bacterium]|nr:carbamate kinase [Vicinamibacteraceae bacterium]
MTHDLIVLAIGGNSLVRDSGHVRFQDQWFLARDTCRHVGALVEAGHRVVVTHGNGPQVGLILRRSELARGEVEAETLDEADADTQGELGYMIQQSLDNEFARRGLPQRAVALVTQVEVSSTSPAFTRPTKPVGAFMDEATARARARTEGWVVGEDAGRGWRRLVPSPEPVAVVEIEAVRTLVAAGFVVIAAGGGGIPVVRAPSGDLHGVEAVIDKDAASALVATSLSATRFVITTAVERVAVHFRTPDERWLDRVSLAEARRYLADGHFAEGSMAPKIRAVIRYLEAGGREALVTSPDALSEALEGRAGTRFVRV